MREIESACEGLSADENVDFARFDILIEMGEAGAFLIVAVEAGDSGVRKETCKLGFEEFGAKTFMHNTRMLTVWAGRRNFFFVTTDMTGENVAVSVQSHGQIALWAEGLPATFFADCQRRRTTTIMKNESLMFIFNSFFYICQ